MRVYVAGPLTKGDQIVNVRNGILAATELVQLGHSPYCPHLAAFWHFLTPLPYEKWVSLDNEWLPLCDALLRLPGESNGADAEVDLALGLGIPVFYSIKELQHWSYSHRPEQKFKVRVDKNT